MNLQTYRDTMLHIRAPEGTEQRILEACRSQGGKKKRAAWRLVPAAALAVLLAVLVPAFGGALFPQPFTLYASASDVTGEVDLAANGVLEWGEGTLFLHFGRSGGDIDRVDLYNEAGRLTCYFDVENAESGAAWTRATLSVPYDDYAACVQDAEIPRTRSLPRSCRPNMKRVTRWTA